MDYLLNNGRQSAGNPLSGSEVARQPVKMLPRSAVESPPPHEPGSAQGFVLFFFLATVAS